MAKILALPFLITAMISATIFPGPSYANAELTRESPPATAILTGARVEYTLRVDEAFLATKMAQFTGEEPVVIAGMATTLGPRNRRAGKDLALSYLKQQYQNLGYRVQLARYGSGTNFIAEKSGADPNRVFTVAAHYDTVNTVGADDDASGVIASLAIAAALKDLPLTYSLRFVAFDEEELGLVGSRAYVKALEGEGKLSQLIGVIVLEMLGYDSNDDGRFHSVDCYSSPSRPMGHSGQLSRLVLAAISAADLPLSRSSACTDRSDHVNFWRADKAAIVLSQNFFGGDANPCYHRSCDTLGKLNLSYLAHLASAAASVAANLVAPEP